jgi:hypothetical protein
MEQLQVAIKDFSDDYLIDQYRLHKDDYTDTALEIFKTEIDTRGLTEKLGEPVPAKKESLTGQISLDKDDFEEFDHTFSHTDLIIAVSVLRANKVLFFADNPSSSDIIPLETEASKRFTIHVHKDSIALAHELLDEHFIKADGTYSLKNSGIRDRLKAFSFSDIKIDEHEAKNLIDVGFTTDEKRVISHYGRRLIDEVDQIETVQDRVVFYYDVIEELLETLESDEDTKLTSPDLLAILEIIQIYCEDSQFPSTMDETIDSLLNFFVGDGKAE